MRQCEMCEEMWDYEEPSDPKTKPTLKCPHCGSTRTVFCPSSQDIWDGCERIQKGWSENYRERKQVVPVPHWSLPNVYSTYNRGTVLYVME